MMEMPPWPCVNGATEHRPDIAIFTRSFFPSAVGAGPSRSLAALVDRLSDEFRFCIVTTDRHTRDDQPLAGVVSNEWTSTVKTRVPVRYCAPDEWGLRRWRRLLCALSPDVYYFNSMFAMMTVRTLLLRRFGLIPRANMIIAPRGEFAPDALALKAPRKRIYLKVVSVLGLLDGVMLQASTEMERDDILAVLGDRRRDVVVAMDMTSRSGPAVADGQTRGRRAKVKGELSLVLVGRVARMKNIDYAIEAVAGMSERVRLDVIGPVEDGAYWAECRALIERLPDHVSVNYLGEIEPDRVGRALLGYDAFFLPTRGENYCHAIVEALRAGLPVLISDRTPWNAVGEEQAGWVFSLDSIDEVRACLAGVAGMDEEAFDHHRQKAREFGAAIGQSDRAEHDNRTMLRRVIGAANIEEDGVTRL